MNKPKTQKIPDKATKILTAAEDLFIAQGFKGVTISAIAQRAHVGKGTTYLYWDTKEDLFLELISRHLAETLVGFSRRIEEEPELAMPHRLVPLLAKTWLAKPIIRALQTADEETLGALIDNPQIQQIFRYHSGRAIIARLLPLWDKHGTITVDWTAEQKQTGLELIISGFGFLSRPSPFMNHLAGKKQDLTEVLTLAISSMLAVKPPTTSLQSLSADIRSALLDQAQQLSDSSL